MEHTHTYTVLEIHPLSLRKEQDMVFCGFVHVRMAGIHVCVFSVCPISAELAPSVEYDRQVLQYEDWLSKQTQYLDVQVKMLEQQIQKQKRAKKTIQARQRQVSVSCSFLLSLRDTCGVSHQNHKMYICPYFILLFCSRLYV